MYYGARYYDPQLAYFISPDSIVPGGAVSTGGGGGTLGQEQNSKLTVDFHERGFAQGVAGENMQIVEQGFWFQLSGRRGSHGGRAIRRLWTAIAMCCSILCGMWTLLVIGEL